MIYLILLSAAWMLFEAYTAPVLDKEEDMQYVVWNDWKWVDSRKIKDK